MGTVEIGDRRVRERNQEGLKVARVGVTRVRANRRQIDGHCGDQRSVSARERPRGAEGGSGWGDSGGVRDTGWLKGWSVRHGVAVGGCWGWLGWLRLGL